MTAAINKDWITFVQKRNDAIYKAETNRENTRGSDVSYLNRPNNKVTNNLMSTYRYNGQEGKLRYTYNTSVKSDPIRLDRYGNEYEEGRRTILTDTTNKYGVTVGSYNFKNSDIKLQHTAGTSKLRTVGYYG